MTTTRHSWEHNRTDNDRENHLQIEFDTCRVCGLVRKNTKDIKNKHYEVVYIEKDGTEHERKIPFPCTNHCTSCRQTVEFTEL